NVSQEMRYYNKSDSAQTEVQLLNWIVAYKNRGTALYDRKIEDRNKELHFAQPQELGKLKSLNIQTDLSSPLTSSDLNSENLYIPLPQKLEPGESLKLQLNYQLQLPLAKFTGYGTSEQNIALKYFFLVPDSFADSNGIERKYLDIEETANHKVGRASCRETAAREGSYGAVT